MSQSVEATISTFPATMVSAAEGWNISPRHSSTILACGETQELSFHRFDSGEVVRDVVLPAALARDESEPALREGLGCTGPHR